MFTRSLEEITDRVPEVVEAVAALPGADAGARRRGDRARPPTAGPGRSRRPAPAPPAALDVATLRAQVPLTSYFFDLLHVDGDDLVDAPGRDRFERLSAVLPPELRRAAHGDRRPRGGRRRLFDRGGRRRPRGRRGQGASTRRTTPAGAAPAWVKVKPRHTLDLVVLAVEWGSGRRQRLAVEHPPRRPRPGRPAAS